MATQAQKTQEAISQAKVEFTPDLVMANPRNGIYAVNAGTGFLRITLPKDKNDELLALRRANASSAQAWLDSTAESVRRQYEKTNSTSFSFTLLPVGEVKVPKAEAVADTSRLPSKIAKAPQISVPKPEVVDSTAIKKEAEKKAREATAERLTAKIPEFVVQAGEKVPKAEFLGGSGKENDRYIIKLNKERTKAGVGANEVTYPIVLSSDAGEVYFQFELTLSQLRASTIEGTAIMMLGLAKRVSKVLDMQDISASVSDAMASFKQSINSAIAKQAKKDPATYQPWADYINEVQKPAGKK